MGTVFISYRRDDDPFAVEQLEAFLAQALGPEEVFRDTSDIRHGSAWRQVIDDAIQRHAVLLVVIGRDWDAPRLHDTDDNVRYEIERGLQSGKLVVPVLVGRAAWPTADQLPSSIASLAALDYAPLRTGADLTRDEQHILETLLAVRPVILRGDVKGRFVLGTVELRVDGHEVARGPMRHDHSFGPLSLAPGDHLVEAVARVTGIGRTSTYQFSARQPGEWHLALDWVRQPPGYSFVLTPPR